jgi:hypothetical protein
MNRKKKEYTNIIAKLYEEHNKNVPFIKKYSNNSIKLNQILNARDAFQNDMNSIRLSWYPAREIIKEFITFNKFIFELLDTQIKENITMLLNTDDISNQIICANLCYNEINKKKQEILELCNKI